MHDSKLISIFKKFNTQDLKELKKFVNSPYFNSKKKLVEFYQYLSKFHPQFEDKKLSKNIASKKLFPSKTFNSKKITDLMSEMMSLVRKFITIDNLQKEDKIHKYITARAFNRKYPFSIFEEEIKKAETAIYIPKKINPIDHLLKFLLKKELYYHPSSPKNPPAGDCLQKANNHLNNFFLSYKLKLILESQLRTRIFSNEKQLKIGMLAQQFEITKNEDPLISIYYDLIVFQQTDELNLSLLANIQTKLNESLHTFPKEDKIIVIHALINHVSYIYHSGNPSLVHQLLKLFKLGLKEQIFISSGKMKHTTFLNISVTAAATNDFELIDKLILKYKKFLKGNSRLDTIRLVQAYNFFHQGNYIDSLEKLNKLSHSRKPEFEFRFRNLEIRCLFEITLTDKTYREVLFTRILNFGKYLARNNILSIEKTVGYQNFVRITNKIAQAINSKKTTEHKKNSLLKELKNYRKIVSFNWLEEKIEGS